MAKVKARLTIREEPFEVDEDELPGLRMQGLLIEDDGPPSDPPDPDGTGGTPKTKPAATARAGTGK